jgi:sporulation protein YlmC with PRC-barrel domain
MQRITPLAALASALLMSVPAMAQDTTTEPAETLPETTIPETTVPETMAPEVTTPGTEVPEITTPEVTTPEVTAPADGSMTFLVPEGYTAVSDWTAITAEQLIGAELYAADGSEIGDIADIVLDGDGKVTGIVADVGGFLGMGVHTVSLDSTQVTIYSNAEADVIASTSLQEDALKALPEYVPPGG